MPSRTVLAERIKAVEHLRRQQERWERDRRVEDRTDRAKKDDELNGVRLQLHDQAGTFVTREYANALEHALDAKIDALERTIQAKIELTFDRLNESGTEGFRETEAARKSREETAERILATVRTSAENSATNRRWLIGLLVTVILGIIANAIAFALLLSHVLTTG